MKKALYENTASKKTYRKSRAQALKQLWKKHQDLLDFTHKMAVIAEDDGFADSWEGEEPTAKENADNQELFWLFYNINEALRLPQTNTDRIKMNVLNITDCSVSALYDEDDDSVEMEKAVEGKTFQPEALEELLGMR